MIKRIIYCFSLVIIFSCQAFAQDIQFSQFYAVTPYQNPAFAGSAHAARFILHNRIQWTGIDGITGGSALSKYTTTLFSVDNYWAKYRSGAALQVFRDWQAGSTLSSTQVGLQYAYELPISRSLTLRSGLQLDYSDRNVDYSKLRFSDDFDNNTGWNGNLYSGQRRQFADVSAGALLYSNRVWGGLSFHHINTPNQSLVGDQSPLPMKFAITGGYKIYLKEKRVGAMVDAGKEVTLTPTIHYKAQGKSDQTDIGLYLIYDQLMAGAWYRGLPFKRYQDFQNTESLVALLGWKFQGFSFGYSYDFTLSKLQTIGAGGAHELNLTYVVHKSNKYKPMKRLPCPDLYNK